MENLWIYLSLFSAFSLATSDALAKKVVNRKNEYSVAWLRLLFCLPPLLVCLVFIEVPLLDRGFYTAFVLALPLEVLSVILYIKALRLSPLGLTLPFLSLTPLFLIVFSYLILDEPVTVQGGLGIFFISTGGYVLNAHTLKRGVLEPVKAIFREKGSLYMIAVAFIYSITSSLGKRAVVHSSPLFFGSTYFIAVTLTLMPLSLKFSEGNIFKVIDGRSLIIIVLSGIAYSLMIVSHMFAINIANVAYMIAIKRTSLLIGVVFGYLIFREVKKGQRFVGALMMFAGFVLIVTSA